MAYITKGIGGFYYVKTPDGIVECKARGIFRKRGITPVAGDNVTLSADGTMIDEILPRKNVFIRPPIANLDILFIVTSTTQPVPSTLVLDQLAAAAIYKDVQPVLVVTKADLAAADMLRTAYTGSGIPLVQLNYETGEGLDEVKRYISGHLCAFCGNSGVGKSTHTRLWQNHFGKNNVHIINDDKPALRLFGNSFTVYGTPFSGNSDENENIKAPLHAVVFLEQCEHNAMKKLTAKEALPYFLYNLPQYSKHAERMNTLLSLLDILLKTTPVYLLSCTPDKSAAILAEQTLFGSTT